MTPVLTGSVVLARSGERAGALLARCGLGATPQPVIIVCGGADELAGSHLAVARSTLGPAISAAASLTNAAVLDGGTASGVMALIGDERAREPDAMRVLLGVAPAGRVVHAGAAGDGRAPLERHHTHVVLADSDEWGGETPLLMALAEQLAQNAPIVMVLVGGGAGTRVELLEGVARGWPLFVVEGTGGIADEVAAALRSTQPGRFGSAGEHVRRGLGRPRTVSSLLGELDGGDVRIVAGGGPDRLRRALLWELQDAPAPKDAWRLFATYDLLAGRLRVTHDRFQSSILLLGVAATLAALLSFQTDWSPLHWVAVAVPIVASVVIALANRRATGKRWVLLRAAAEAIKSEIYRYRTATGVYSAQALRRDRASAPLRLVDRLAEIEGRLVQTEASGASITPYDGPLPPDMYGAEAGDDGLTALDATRYVEFRVADQLVYYRGKVRDLDRRRGILHVVLLAAGGAGAFLAAVDAEIWVGLTTAVGGAALAYLGYLQFDSTIVAYNQAAAQLGALEREFRARDREMDVEQLVGRGEAVLTTEHGGWVEQMTAALEQQKTEQAKAASQVDPDADADDDADDEALSRAAKTDQRS